MEPAINSIKENQIKDIFVLAQTTFRLEKFEDMVEILKKELQPDCNLVIKNTICQATQKRQQETKEIAKKVDFMIIIGGKHSSNTKKLYDIASNECPTILIEEETELDIETLNPYSKIGIMAGASTPKESIESVVNKLAKVT